jgi:hypothetical protein
MNDSRPGQISARCALLHSASVCVGQATDTHGVSFLGSASQLWLL